MNMIFLQIQHPILDDKLIQFIYMPILIWMALVLIFLYALSRKYTFGKWTADNPNPYCNETWGMPRGVMRGILTLSLLFALLLLEIFAIENPTFESNISQFIVAFQMMLAFYFGSQVMHHLTTSEQAKSTHIADTIAKVEETKAGARVMSAAASSSNANAVEEALGENDFDDEEAVG